LNFLMKRKQEGIHVYGERGTGWPQDREGLGQEDLQHHIALEGLAMFCWERNQTYFSNWYFRFY
jgi:hypothetical protein